jgi:di/tricarboxylate transporter
LPRDLQAFLKKLELDVVDPGAPMAPLLQSESVGLVEAIVVPGSELEHRTAMSARLQRQYGVNLLAVSRQGRPYRGRLRAFRFEAGDVLLLQGEADRLHDVVGALGCLPLAERGLKPPPSRTNRSWQALACFAGAVGLAIFGVFPIAIALMAGVLGMLAFRVLQMRQAYEAIDWPIIVLLGALIPVGDALQTSGAAAMISDALLAATAGQAAWLVLALLMLATTALTNVLNNAATAVVMAPLAGQIAGALGVSPDPFFMGVAVSASCAFLTPIGHQNNALVMGPGGYQFGDYWRMGLPLTVLSLSVALPMILWVFPLGGVVSP